MERRLAEDLEYRAKVERLEAEEAERVRQLRATEAPVVEDLAGAGIDVSTVWDLHKRPESRAVAIPILLNHLTRDYPDGVLEGIGQGLDDRTARDRWRELKDLYLRTERPVVRDRLAAALSNCAVKRHYEDLLAFLGNTDLGDTRIYFLRPVNRIGNRMSPGAGRAVVESWTDDPVLGKEASAILNGRGPND